MPELTNQQLIDEMKRYMIKNNLRQKDLAFKLDVNESQVNRWINGKNTISKGYVSYIKDKLGIYTDDIEI